jgi:hypothetical protein
VERKICPGCGEGLDCGRAAGRDRCWCADLPRIMPVPEIGAGCYCPKCLEREIQRRQERDTP